MGKTVAVSFEGNSVKVLHSSLKGKALSISKTEVIPESRFDDYLSTSKASEYIVSYNFIESVHDMITVPPVKAKFLDKVIESKIRKATNRRDITYITFEIGEQISGNKKELEIYYFGVSNEELKSVMDRFHNFGKTVRAIYPSLFSAASLIRRSFRQDPVLGAFNTGNEMGVFFLKKGDIHFIRNYESTESTMSDFDIQNINMTINYCFQNLRTNPSSVILLGGLASSSEITSATVAPLASYYKPDDIKCSNDIFSEFLLPISSVYTSNASNIMGRDFKNVFALRSYMTYAASLFIVIAVLMSGFTLYKGSRVADKRESIKKASSSLHNVDRIYAEYQERSEKLDRLMKMVNYMHQTSPDLAELLLTIGSISSSNVTFQSIEAKMNRDNMFIVVIKGTSSVDSYSSMQASFEELIDVIKGIKNAEVAKSDLHISSQSFSLEFKYKKSA